MFRLAACAFVLITTLANAADPPRIFELREDKSAAGKLNALLARVRDRLPRLYTKHGITVVGTFVPIENGDSVVYTLLGWPNSKARTESWDAFNGDPAVKAMMNDTDRDGKIVVKSQTWVLTPTDYSPVVPPEKKGNRIFEFRFYTLTPGSRDAFNARFRDHTMKLFEKHGITNIGYWNVKAENNFVNDRMVSMLAHESLESAKKSSTSFHADPAWNKVKLDSEKKVGTSLTTRDGIRAVLVKPTDESPMK
jgi:hypothetical protein